MNKKRLIITSIISIILVSILFIGSTYSIFTSSDIDENLNVYQTGNLNVTMTSNNIKLENATPTSIENALNITPHRVTIENNGTVPYMLKVILADTSAGEVIDYQYLYTKVGKLEEKPLDSCNSATAIINGTTYTGKAIKEGVIVPANGIVNIDVRIWISDTVQNTEMGKSFYGKLIIDGEATYDYNNEIDNSILETDLTISAVEPGSYVSLTPTKSSYKTDTNMTGYSDTQTINPQELNLWRVIRLNADGTVDVISEYVSSVDVSFYGKTGYQNLVGYLNVLASQYENSAYTTGSRYFGYNGQTEYITDTSKFTNPAPWTCSTGESCNPVESQGGGDELYLTDYNLVNTVLGTRVATNPSGTAKTYWMASRYYNYNASNFYYWASRTVNTDGNNTYSGSNNLYAYYGASTFTTDSRNYALRPILTLKSGLKITGEGTEASPYQLGN